LSHDYALETHTFNCELTLTLSNSKPLTLVAHWGLVCGWGLGTWRISELLPTHVSHILAPSHSTLINTLCTWHFCIDGSHMTDC